MHQQRPVAFDVILCATAEGAIGANGKLLYRLPRDMERFRKLTTTTAPDRPYGINVVIMGRRTWESLPAKYRPLPQRFNVVLTSNADQCNERNTRPCTRFCASFEEALTFVYYGEHQYTFSRVLVIGGARVYYEALRHPACDLVHCTHVHSHEADKRAVRIPHFAHLRTQWYLLEASDLMQEEAADGVVYSFATYRRRNVDEIRYLDEVRALLALCHDAPRPDRTGVGTYSQFGKQMRFDLRHRFPLLTTKRVFWKGVVEELLWMVRGSTSAKELAERGVNIWNANATREFLDTRGLSHYEEGELGSVYGHQWRHFGAPYRGANSDYTGEGVDQLQECIRMIKEDPYSRRIVMSAWNPAALHEMALPPCHMFCQFYVSTDGYLSCHMYQRSADMGLGVPFNIASYSLLTYMVAHVCELKPRELVHTLGDAHVYANHCDALKQQVEREPRAFPTLHIARRVEAIDAFTLEDFVLTGYKPYPRIKMAMAV